MQSLLLIRDGIVVVQNATKNYTDTTANFIADGGTIIGNNIDYNKGTGNYIVNGKLGAYPNANCEKIIENIATFLTAQQKRAEVK